MRQFESGANRSSDAGKLDYEGFLSPLVLEAFAAYMDVNRACDDGTFRASDNWQKGMPIDQYMKSKWRHFLDLWKCHRGHKVPEGELGASCGDLFNTMGWIFERIKADPDWLGRELAIYREYRKKELDDRKKT